MVYRYSWIAGVAAIAFALWRLGNLLEPSTTGIRWQLVVLAALLFGLIPALQASTGGGGLVSGGRSTAAAARRRSKLPRLDQAGKSMSSNAYSPMILISSRFWRRPSPWFSVR